MLRPYSPNQPEFRSENDLTCRWFWTLRQATAGRGIWLIDRGADRPEVLSALLRVQRRWVVRLRQDRALLGPDGRVLPAGRWAEWALANRNVRGNAVTLPVSLPPDQVPQYGTPPNLHLVVPTHTFPRNERFMVRSFTAIERMLWCATLAGGFLSRLLREEPELSRELQEEVLYEDTDVVLPVYRLARGLHALAARHGPAATLAVNA
jgi:hypothetical protein